MKNILYCFILFSLFLCVACEKEDNIVPDGAIDENVPKPGDNPVDTKIYELYTKYGSSFLYNFDRTTYDWAMVRSENQFDSLILVQTPADLDSKLTYLEENWLAAYSPEFLKGKLPYRVLLLDSIAKRSSPTGWPEFVSATSGLNYLAIAHMGDSFEATDKPTLKTQLHLNFILYLLEKGFMGVPAGFYDISADLYETNVLPDNPRTWWGLPQSEQKALVNEQGFLFVDYKQYGLYDTKIKDLKEYITFLIETPEADVQGLIGAYPKMVQKYKLLKDYFDSLGINFQN